LRPQFKSAIMVEAVTIAASFFSQPGVLLI
jgi:hypothetical protein